MDNNKKILVTGATGFIGGRIMEVFYLQTNYNIVGSVRSWNNAARIARFPIELRELDLLKKEMIFNALKDVEVVIHTAYGNRETTVTGTENLLNCAHEMGIKHIIHLSTIEVYTSLSGEITEESKTGKTGNIYGDSKYIAEELCKDFIGKGLPITILRLPIVYGPFSRNWTIKIGLQLARNNLGKLVEFGEGTCNLVYIDDVVRAIMTCLKSEKSQNKIYNLNGPEIITWNEYFDLFGRALGLHELKYIPKRAVTLKSFLMRPVRRLGGYVRDHHMDKVKFFAERSQFLNSVLRGMEMKLRNNLSKEELVQMKRKYIIVDQKIRKELNFSPQIGIVEGITYASDWLKVMGIRFFRKIN